MLKVLLLHTDPRASAIKATFWNLGLAELHLKIEDKQVANLYVLHVCDQIQLEILRNHDRDVPEKLFNFRPGNTFVGACSVRHALFTAACNVISKRYTDDIELLSC